MAGRIVDEDIALVRERVRIEDVVSQYVTLRPAGAGSLKGLCPFHDEKSPSFNVRPQVGHSHCFGCGVGGDAIWFLREIEGLSFVEAVERLADQVGVQLRREDGGPERPRRDPGARNRMLEAHRLAAEYYSERLASDSEAVAGRTFLHERGFDRQAAEHFGIGYAPRGPGALLNHLRAKGFADEELITAGLVAEGARGRYDRFRGRLLWPIRELSGAVVGFGARRLYDDDRVEAKYLNTPETPIYHKSQVLYGVDLARKEIAKRSQAVIVEGYTDVMACHMASVPVAVATCGTAFGDEHVTVLRRLLLDHESSTGEVIFTFDGDEAGQRAALRAFSGDDRFSAQTYVAVEPNGLDPCDLRLRHGDAAVRDLIARRTPLYRFVLGNILARYDLDRADSRVDALRAAAPLVTSVRDRTKVAEYARELSRMLGMDLDQVRGEVERALNRRGDPRRGDPRQAAPVKGARAAGFQLPNPNDPRHAAERELLQVVLQAPAAAGADFDALEDEAFEHPAYVLVRRAVAEAGGAGSAAGGEAWVAAVSEAAVTLTGGGADDDGAHARRLVTELAVRPLPVLDAPDRRYAESLVARLAEVGVARRISEVKSKLQRMNPVDNDDHRRLFGELVALERRHAELRERRAGGAGL